MEYYIYAYVRKNGTPYYIGKGKGYRAYDKLHTVGLPPKSRIVIMETNLTEVGALALERFYIKWYGRKDLGNGILRNRTDGGEGISGFKHSEETKTKMSKSQKGRKLTEAHKKALSGRKFTDEHIKKLRMAKIGKKTKPQRKVTCPHCGMLGGINTMKQWHFQNCKQIKET